MTVSDEQIEAHRHRVQAAWGEHYPVRLAHPDVDMDSHRIYVHQCESCGLYWPCPDVAIVMLKNAMRRVHERLLEQRAEMRRTLDSIATTPRTTGPLGEHRALWTRVKAARAVLAKMEGGGDAPS